MPATKVAVAEFFAGAGLARLGLEATDRFEVVYANDVDEDKAKLYRARFEGTGDADHLHVADVHTVQADDVPAVDLAWASFPCTDVSLAGDREGLAGLESGTWWAFHRILTEMKGQDRLPKTVAVENVVGLATSGGGADLERVLGSLDQLGYACDVLTIDARHFLPQSRPRLFIVAALDTGSLLEPGSPHEARPEWLRARVAAMGVKTFAPELPPLPTEVTSLPDHLERVGSADERWWDEERVARFHAELSEVQRTRLETLRRDRRVAYRTAYRRTRKGVPVWEIRPDAIAGCLRTVRGGSSKQAVVKAGRGDVSVRWMTPKEYVNLMGASSYPIEQFRPNQVYFGFGDAVAVPAVQWLAEHHLSRLIPGGGS